MATIYLGTKEENFQTRISINLNVSIQGSKSTYQECKNFDVVTYTINYSGSYHNSLGPLSFVSNFYKLLLYKRSRTNSGSDIYQYRPNKIGDIVKQVDSYYHILDTDTPIALVFNTRDSKKYCRYEQLNFRGSSSVLPGLAIKDEKLSALLLSVYRSKYTTLLFTLGTRDNPKVLTKQQNIAKSRKYKKVTFYIKPGTHQGSGVALYSGKLFTLKPSNHLKNENPSYPESVKDKKFYAVIVYYTDSSNEPRDLAVLIQFVSECNIIHLRRSSNNPIIWLEDSADYNDDDQLSRKLDLIKKESESAIIYRLEKNGKDSSYGTERITVEKVQQEYESGYTVYKHTAGTRYKASNALILYNNSDVKLIENDSMEGVGKLATLNNQKFTEIKTYSFSHNEREHLLIKITWNSNNYYLHRFNKKGDKWKQLSLLELMDAGIDVISVTARGSSQLLDRLLEEKSQSDNLKAVLNYIEFSVNSIAVLVDKKLPYDQSEINSLISDEIPTIDISPNSINVVDRTGTFETCFGPDGYRVYKHDLQKAGQAVKKKLQDGKLYLRLYLERDLIKLCNESGNSHTFLEYKELSNQLYVYYYGTTDPRPLLFCYADKAYRPESLLSYRKKWVKVEKTIKCECQNDGNNKELLMVLSDVVGILNAVQIQENQGQYQVQDFKVRIYIKVSEERLNGFKKYVHEPNTGYTLGKVEYRHRGESKGSITYGDVQGLNKFVTTYYLEHDTTRKNPLLVQLEFKNSIKKSFQLKNANTSYEWDPLSYDKIKEDNPLHELFEINKKLDSKDSIGPEEPSIKDTEPTDGDNTVTIATSTTVTLGLAGGGTGLVIYKYSDFFLSLLTKVLSKGAA
ncbi:hypothetical protein MACK_001277 [Theileria orientalis]|uniref:Uncharacterized protein n=1 Tax=Theileria orientalis TaxID=68886 RepID=A0A976MEL7_THEOR|nr:hypothetical protein MACK_001277 [Theileria orientalis]